METAIKIIESDAFEGCDSLQSISIPDSVTSIGSQAFNGCRSLRSINIPYGIAFIAKDAFANCEFLSNVTLPKSFANYISLKDLCEIFSDTSFLTVLRKKAGLCPYCGGEFKKKIFFREECSICGNPKDY